MKIQHVMRTKFVGSIIGLAIAMMVFSSGVLVGSYYQQKFLEDEHHLLPKEFYECVVGMMLNNPEQTKVCIVYRVKGINFDGNNHPRHREHNQEQGKRIHSF